MMAALTLALAALAQAPADRLYTYSAIDGGKVTATRTMTDHNRMLDRIGKQCLTDPEIDAHMAKDGITLIIDPATPVERVKSDWMDGDIYDVEKVRILEGPHKGKTLIVPSSSIFNAAGLDAQRKRDERSLIADRDKRANERRDLARREVADAIEKARIAATKAASRANGKSRNNVYDKVYNERIAAAARNFGFDQYKEDAERMMLVFSGKINEDGGMIATPF